VEDGGEMDKTVLVTGGGRGIGAAVSRLAAQRGYAVCLNYAQAAAPAEALAKEIRAAGGHAFAHRADVSKADEVEALFSAVERELGALSALVNNGGIAGHISRLDDADPAEIQRVMDVNAMGTMLCARGGASHVDAPRRAWRCDRQYFLGRRQSGQPG